MAARVDWQVDYMLVRFTHLFLFKMFRVPVYVRSPVLEESFRQDAFSIPLTPVGIFEITGNTFVVRAKKRTTTV